MPGEGWVEEVGGGQSSGSGHHSLAQEQPCGKGQSGESGTGQ